MSVWSDKLLYFSCGLEKIHAGIRPWPVNFHLAMGESTRNPALAAGSCALSRGVFRGADNRAED